MAKAGIISNFLQAKEYRRLENYLYFQQLNNKIYPYLRFGTTNPYSTW